VIKNTTNTITFSGRTQVDILRLLHHKRDMPNVIAIPHTADFSDAILQRMAEKFLENLGHYARGEPFINVARLS
jgi:lactate dehydrogenase-like 2-hydroxyacid dehydrogenase